MILDDSYTKQQARYEFAAKYCLGSTLDYSFSSIGIFMDEYTRLSFQRIVNHTDGSNVLFPQVDYSLMDDVDLSLLIFIFNGDHKTEFGINDWGFKSRIQIYF